MSDRKINNTAKRKGGDSKESVIIIPSDLIISKIIQHSKEKNSHKFLKYLLHAKKSFSSSNLKLWKDLRSRGGLQAIETVVRSLVDTDFINNEKIKSTKLNFQSHHHPRSRMNEGEDNLSTILLYKDVCIAGLSVLGNAYSLDYAARKEVGTNGFIQVLHKLIQMSLGGSNSFTTSNTGKSTSVGASSVNHNLPECDVSTKAVKCIANLSHDSACRDIILKSGVGISILKILERFNEVMVMEEKSKGTYIDKDLPDSSLSTESKLSNMTDKEDQKECIKASVRAIRILSSEPICNVMETKIHLIRFGAVITIGNILSWSGKFFSHDDFTLDIVRALTSLTDRIRLLPSDQIEELVSEDNDNKTLQKLVTVFEACTDEGKLFSPIIRCLTNLSRNTSLAESFGLRHLFKISLEKLKTTSVKASSEICRLLMTLTKHSSVNQCVLNNCLEVWSTLNVLKSNDLQEYHRWVLHVYENVYEGSLKSLHRNGLVELIHHHLKEELEDCDLELLKRKITSLDDDNCRVHTATGCQFVPVYRCDSPSYQQVQEEVKILLMGREAQNKMDTESSSSGVDSSSPSSSPARSWISEDSSSESGWTRARSPNSSGSEDEGCYSPVYSHISSPTYSETSQDRNVTLSDEETLQDSFSKHHQVKRPRLQLLENTEERDISHHSSRKSSENIKAKSKKIVSMLNILHKSTFLNPMPQSLVRVVPMLLSFIVRGIVSLTPQRDKYDQDLKDLESITLGKQSFSFAYRILKTIFSDINMFPELVKNGTISIIFRLLPWDKFLVELGSNQSLGNLLETLSGNSNNTHGWREGYLLRTLLISKCENELDKIALAIPLLFRKNDHVLRNFETKGNGWSRVFELVSKTDEINFSQFQDCVLSLSALCETIGMKWTDASDVKNRPLLFKSQESIDLLNVITFVDNHQQRTSTSTIDPNSSSIGNQIRVDLELDDGSCVRISKDILTKASPVFSAMFDGHFIEAGLQKVRIRDVSKEAIKALMEQIIILNSISSNERVELMTSIESDHYELSTLFELISLSDQFLLEGIYERTLNSILCYYICPYSAPIIYAEAVKLCALWKPQSRLQGWTIDLTYIILKYLLVGDLSMSSRCGAFRKIFDTVTPSIVVGDLRALVEYYCSRPPTSIR